MSANTKDSRGPSSIKVLRRRSMPSSKVSMLLVKAEPGASTNFQQGCKSLGPCSTQEPRRRRREMTDRVRESTDIGGPTVNPACCSRNSSRGS